MARPSPRGSASLFMIPSDGFKGNAREPLSERVTTTFPATFNGLKSNLSGQNLRLVLTFPAATFIALNSGNTTSA